MNHDETVKKTSVFVTLLLIAGALASSSASAASVAQTRSFGTDAHAAGVAAYGSDTYVAGWTNAAFPGFTLEGPQDAFLRKSGPTGSHIWMRQVGGPGYDAFYDVATDPTGVYVVQNSYDEGILTELVKFSHSGTRMWERTLPDASDTLAIGGMHIYVLTGSGLAKYSRAGALLWTRDLAPHLDNAYLTDIVANATDVFVMGVDTRRFYWNDPAPPGFKPHSIRKYNSSGDLLWTGRFGTLACEGADYVTGSAGAIAVDSSGLYATAGRDCTVEDGSGFAYTDYKNSVAKLSLATGQVLWSRSATLSGDPWVTGEVNPDLAVNANGVYFAGSDAHEGWSEENDVLVLKFGKDGTRSWGLSFQVEPSEHELQDYTTDVVASPSTVWITGVFNSESGAWPVFLARVTE